MRGRFSGKLLSFKISRFKSILDISLDVGQDAPTVICGENNIGKTNFLRAMDLYFNHIYFDELFDAKEDVPYHIYFGSRGAGAKVEMTGIFDVNGRKTSMKIIFKDGHPPVYSRDSKTISPGHAIEFLEKFRYLFIESSNIDLPDIMSEILEEDGLLALDKKRSKQSEPLKKLREFIDLSQNAISDIEKGINKCFERLTDFDGVLAGKKVKIDFAEFDKLRDVLRTMTSITLYDGNNLSIASKGSGAQRAVFMSLMQYISQNSTKSIIWGIDEPEVFLQPKLQKRLFSVVKSICKDQHQPVILTTHSPNFVDLSDLSHVNLFDASNTEKHYSRKPGVLFYENDTYKVEVSSSFEKAARIKEHLGVGGNDGWNVMPFNLLVEGEEDKKYLELMFSSSGMSAPNIIWSGGASKLSGYLQFYNVFSKNLDYQPCFICLLDNDDEGRSQYRSVKGKKFSNIKVKPVLLRRHDGKKPSETSQVKWSVEDFIAPKIIFSAINSILRSEGYRQILVKSINERYNPANCDVQILQYAEICAAARNPEMDRIEFTNDGRKKQICLRVVELASKGEVMQFTESQREFLQSLASFN